MLFFLTLLSCQTTKIPNTRFYAEIPFLDCPEGAYVETLTQKTGIIPCDEWKLKRPYMVMIDPEGKKMIFNQWYEACRRAGDSCNVQLDSVRKTIELLDALAAKIIPLPGGTK